LLTQENIDPKKVLKEKMYNLFEKIKSLMTMYDQIETFSKVCHQRLVSSLNRNMKKMRRLKIQEFKKQYNSIYSLLKEMCFYYLTIC